MTASSQSQQAENSADNPRAATTDMRILIELQLQSQILAQGFGISEDLARMRQDIANSIT